MKVRYNNRSGCIIICKDKKKKENLENFGMEDNPPIPNEKFMGILTSTLNSGNMTNSTYGYISKWNTSQVTNMSSYNKTTGEYDAKSIFSEDFNEDISGWNVGMVTDMGYMFYKCTSFNQDLSNWDINAVTSMKSMFTGCTNFNSKLFKFTSGASNGLYDTSYMFKDCVNYDQPFDAPIYGIWAPKKIKGQMSQVNAQFMFQGATKFNQPIDILFGINFGHEPAHILWINYNIQGMLPLQPGDAFGQDISSWFWFPTVTDKEYDNYMLYEVAHNYTKNPTKYKQIFGEPNKWNVSKIELMESLFAYNDFNEDISGWDVSSVTNMDSMFLDATKFNQNISGWDVSKVTSMSEMFKQTAAFNQDLSTWKVNESQRGDGTLVTACVHFNASASKYTDNAYLPLFSCNSN